MADKRELAGISLLKKKIGIIRTDESTYCVSSQSDLTRRYEIKWCRNRWVCNCKDFEKRGKKCKHIFALDYFLMLNEMRENSEVIGPGVLSPRPNCPKCNLNLHVIKRGFRYKRSGEEQRYYCKPCKHRFVKESAFKWMRTKAKIIASALDLYFKGLSLRSISSHLEDSYGVKVSHATIHNWLKKFVKIVNKYIETKQVETSDRWLADEIIVRVTGRHVVWWNLLDSESRYLIAKQISFTRDSANAQELLKKGIKVSKTKLTEFVTDGLPSYSVALENEIKNIANEKQSIIHLQGPLLLGLNNKVERYHGEVRSRLKTMNHLGNEESVETFADGFTINHNCIKRHKSLNGKTPAQAVGIDKDKSNWLNLIIKAYNQEKISEDNPLTKR